MPKQCTFPVAAAKMAEGAGLQTKPTMDGRVRIVDSASKALLGIARNEQEAKEIIEKFVGQNMRELSGQHPIPTNGTPLSQSPQPIQGTLRAKVDRGVRGVVSGLQFGPLAIITPIEKFAQAAERLGKGQAFTKVVQTTKAARAVFKEALAKAPRPRLNGLFGAKKDSNFQSIAQRMQKVGNEFSEEQRQLITRYNEWRTKGELTAPGALLEGGLDEANVFQADFFSILGVADDIPNMLRQNAIIDDFLASRQEMVEFVIPKMQLAIKEQRLPAEFAERLEALAAAAGTEDTAEALMKTMGLSANEQVAMVRLRDLVGNEEMNIPAIYRYATAPELEAGFKNGADQMAAKMGMEPKAVAFAKERIKYLEETFVEEFGEGIAPELQSRILGAQLPVFREFISVGLLPGTQFGKSMRPAINKWANILQQFSEGNEILGRRVLSGHIDPFDLDPAVTAHKHASNMLNRVHMDPVMNRAKGVVENIAANIDERTGRIMINYLHELQGIPTESFQKLNEMIRSVARSFNVGMDDRVAEKLISTLSFATYSASIPFRYGLIARNAFQTTLNVPIIGGEAWHKGLKMAMGFGHPDGVSRADFMQSAWEAAVKGGALVVDNIPLHGGTEAIGGVREGLFGPMRSEFAKVGYNVRELFNAGFSMYRKPDDIGRVISFHAGRSRVNKAVEGYQKRGPGKASMEQFKREAKVKTFDETIEAQFETLVLQDRVDDAANLIGAKLADKVHFLYGDASHPAGWGSVAGRLLGQFGTFPVQYLSHVTESLTRGTLGDRAQFLAAHSALNLGIVSAGATLFDADLESWAFAPSIHYTGGPWAEVILSLASAWSGSEAEQSLALRNVKMMLPSWNRPSIFVPGSYFVSDVFRAAQQDDFAKAVAQFGGLRFLEGRPSATEDFFAATGLEWLNEL